MTRTAFFAAATLCGACIATAAAAQEVTLKVTHTYPANHYLIEHGLQILMDRVEQGTDGQVKFEVYPAGQLGKDHLGNLSSGLADLALMSPSAESSALVLSTVAELPGAYSTACEGSALTAALMQEGSVLDTNELSGRGIHFLYAASLPPYPVFSGPKPFHAIEDLAGLKIRAGGAAISKSFRLLDAVPIQIPGSEMFDSLKRGTVDGAFFSTVGVPTYNLEEVMSSAIMGTDIGGATNFAGISAAAWEKLSDEQKKIFTEAAAEAQESFCAWIDEASKDVIDNMVEEHGMELTVLTDEQRTTLLERLAPVREEWVAEMEAAGKDGRTVLEAWEAARTE